MNFLSKIKYSFSTLIGLLLCATLTAQTVNVGAASYTKTFPGTDAAGRNGYPSGTPYIIGNATGKPVPTNDWWSAKLNSDHVSNLFSYPITMKTVNSGLVMTYIPWGVIDDYEPITIGVSSLNASRANVSDYSDWTVTMNWASGANNFTATAGIAMPFVYFTKGDTDVAQVKIKSGVVTINNEIIIIENTHRGGSFAIYAPSGSDWQKNGDVYTSTLNGKNYFSAAILPEASVSTTALAYRKYAYVFPKNTETTWQYNEKTSVVRTEFAVTPDVKEGVDTKVLMGLLPHQWSNLAPDSPVATGKTYSSVRGDIKTMGSNGFSVENAFYGILPTLPYLDNYSEGFDPTELNNKVAAIENDGLATWTDSYNEGQVMNRLIQTARIADLTGNTVARDKMVATVKERLEDWLTYESGEVAFLFYYNPKWSAMIGYPAGHGQDGNLNDHHFHWGYFIHAAAFMEQFEPGWAAQWGDMINLLVRDAASPSREDDLFPFLRNFSPYAGHCWANGFATFPQGNDQESTSESMQFNSSLIHWGTVTGNDEIRDLGIYLYSTEQTAIEEYWLDINERNFKDNQQFSLVSRVWGNSYDNGTFWTSDIAASYGIEMYPIHGGSLYLGHNHDYVQKLWSEIEKNTGILDNQVNPNLWHDIMWEYLAFIDPSKAIELYESNPDRELKFGVSDAQTYYWLHAMNAMGKVDATVTADYPIASVFSNGSERTYTAHNYTNEPITVTFSDGQTLEVPANAMGNSKDVDLKGSITSAFSEAFPNGNIPLTVNLDEGTATKVVFYDGSLIIGEKTTAPFEYNATDLQAGIHSFYAKIYDGNNFSITNIITCKVGRVRPYSGTPLAIPGVIESAHYDKFEGGNGQGITYTDLSQKNEGGYRSSEYVDAEELAGEGAIVGWINAGEWLSYTVQVDQAGLYDMSLRYASGNSSGGGPFYLELDGAKISNDITVSSSGGWDKWTSKTVNNIPFKAGKNSLRIHFKSGELNFGKMTFSYGAPLSFDQPTANAGGNKTVVLPATSMILDGSQSSNQGSASLSYQWTQVYGPSTITFSDITSVTPQLSDLQEGVYLVELSVSNGSYTDSDDAYIIVGTTDNIPPTVLISSPENGEDFIDGKDVMITAQASDFDGAISKVEFFVDGNFIGEDNESPYQMQWNPSGVGEYRLTAKATDDDASIGTSQPSIVVITEAPSCEGTSENGDFSYRFSADANNPTLTFIPTNSGTGSPTCILYYGTGGGPFPGYMVTPNTPFSLNASEGTTINFYYTYTYAGGGEKNTADKMISYTIGSCSDASGIEGNQASNIITYPNPVESILTINTGHEYYSKVSVYAVTGEKKTSHVINNDLGFFELDLSSYASGVYILKLENNKQSEIVRVIKQ